MESNTRPSKATDGDIVELTRVPPIEAEVIVARLGSYGITAIVDATSVYPSLTVVDGVPVMVLAADLPRARALLEDDNPPL